MPHRTHLRLVRILALVTLIAGVAIAVPAAATDRVVVVHPGDTLSEIALKHGVSVAQLRALNGIADPNRIYAGQHLRLTGQAESATPALTPKANEIVHLVERGQTLTGIARRYGSTIAAIARANGRSCHLRLTATSHRRSLSTSWATWKTPPWSFPGFIAARSGSCSVTAEVGWRNWPAPCVITASKPISRTVH